MCLWGKKESTLIFRFIRCYQEQEFELFCLLLEDNLLVVLAFFKNTTGMFKEGGIGELSKNCNTDLLYNIYIYKQYTVEF